MPDSNYKKQYLKYKGNPIVTLLEKFPNADWDWQNLVRNPNISLDMIVGDKRFSGIQYKYAYLSGNTSLDWKFIQERKNKKWDYGILSANSAITWEIVQQNPDIPWDFKSMSLNPNITWEIVLSNPDKGWNYSCLSINPSITLEIVQQNPDKPWGFEPLSANSSITPKIMKDNLQYPWNFFWASLNTSLTQKFIEINSNEKWSDYKLMCNPSITWNIIKYNKLKWSTQYLSTVSNNPNITVKIIEENPDFPWNFNELSANIFLHNDTAYRRSLKIDRKKRQYRIKPYISKYLIKDVVIQLLEYIDYD